MEGLTRSDIIALEELTATAGWQVLTRELGTEISDIEEKLLSLRGKESKELKYNDDDLLRVSRNIYISLLNNPKETIESFL